jgi:hypothetical protein
VYGINLKPSPSEPERNGGKLLLMLSKPWFGLFRTSRSFQLEFYSWLASTVPMQFTNPKNIHQCQIELLEQLPDAIGDSLESMEEAARKYVKMGRWLSLWQFVWQACFPVGFLAFSFLRLYWLIPGGLRVNVLLVLGFFLAPVLYLIGFIIALIIQIPLLPRLNAWLLRRYPSPLETEHLKKF